MDDMLRYEAERALALIDRGRLKELEPRLTAARQELLDDVALLDSKAAVPASKEPLDAGFIELPRRLLDDVVESGGASLIGRILRAALPLRDELEDFVVLGIGGSYMGARALCEALCPAFYNFLPRERRRGPRLFFEGNNLDNDSLRGLLEVLQVSGRWGLSVISKSGGTLETAVAFRLFRRALDERYGASSDEARRYIVPISGEVSAVTGKKSRLRELAEAAGYEHVFPIPDGVGGRFSIFTAVGLFPAAMLGLDIERLLAGAADITDRFRSRPPGDNPVLDYTAVCHVFEQDRGCSIRVLSTWGARLEALGLWYDQLLSESLGKEERGATPITVVNTRDLHSRGQQHQEGALDKLITNVLVEAPAEPPLELPRDERDHDQLNQHAGKTLPEFLRAAFDGTNRAYADAARPTADIRLPRLDEYTVGQLLQMLMLATVLEGRLIGINPYGQPGVEAYKRNMEEILRGRST